MFGGRSLADLVGGPGLGPFRRSCGALFRPPPSEPPRAFSRLFLHEARHSTLQHRYGLVRRNGRIHGHSRHTGIETKELQQLCPGQAAMR
jgi:hypothetical protein